MLLFLSSLLRIILVLLIIRIVLRGLVDLYRGRRATPSPSAPRPAPRLGVDLVKDRICNTYVPRDRALRAVVQGREEHFCSGECKSRALAAAAQAS